LRIFCVCFVCAARSAWQAQRFLSEPAKESAAPSQLAHRWHNNNDQREFVHKVLFLDGCSLFWRSVMI
jgi:hypothetical protein